MQAKLHCLLNQAGIIDSRDDRHASRLAILNDPWIESWADDEIHPCFYSLIHLGCSEHGPRPDGHVGEGGSQLTDGIGRSGCAEGDFRTRHAVVHQSLPKGHCIISILDSDDGDDLQAGQLFKQY
ncbi:hypothetical protein D3C78_1398310 [compost metagenome]